MIRIALEREGVMFDDNGGVKPIPCGGSFTLRWDITAVVIFMVFACARRMQN